MKEILSNGRVSLRRSNRTRDSPRNSFRVTSFRNSLRISLIMNRDLRVMKKDYLYKVMNSIRLRKSSTKTMSKFKRWRPKYKQTQTSLALLLLKSRNCVRICTKFPLKINRGPRLKSRAKILAGVPSLLILNLKRWKL